MEYNRVLYKWKRINKWTMTDEQLNKYYEVDRKYNGCILEDSQCPLKEHCNWLVRNKCREHIPSEISLDSGRYDWRVLQIRRIRIL